MSVFDEERKKLGLTGKKNTGRSAFDDERINAGLIKDDRPKRTLPTKLVLEDTLKSVMKPTTKTIDFKADQKKKTAPPLEGKLPAASLLVGDNNKKLQNTLKGKLPAPSLAMNNSGESKKDKSTVFDAIDNINAFTDRVKSSATLGGTKLVDQIFATKIGTKESKQDMKDKLARAENVKGGMIADVAGSLVSGKTAYELGGKLVTPIVKNAPKLVQKLVKGAAAGAAFEAPRQAHEILGERYGGEQQSLKQRGINVAVSAGMGGLADLSVGLGGLAASGIKNNLVSKAVGGAIGVGGIGASMGAANEVQQAVSGQQQSIGGRLKDVGKYAAIGAGIGLLGGAGASQLMKKSETPVQPIEEPIQEAPIRSTEPPVRQAEPVIQERTIEEPVQPKVTTDTRPVELPRTAREAELIQKANNKEELTQDDIDYLLELSNDPAQNPVAPKPKGIEVEPIVDEKPIVSESNSTPEQKVKGERGFVQTLRDSEKVPEAVKLMDSKYEPIRNQDSLDVANNRIKDMDKAKNDILSNKVSTNADSIATAQRLIQEYTKMGDHSTAALIAEKAAADLTTAGQTIQAASMWNRLSAEGMLIRVQREIAKVNDTLAPMETKLSLSTADAAKISNTGEAMGKVQSVRDLSEEVISMINKKTPGSQLTPEETALLTQFEKKVKSVNDSVKPFLKGMKSEAQKIEKIKPEHRTRDQVVTFLDDKAQRARERIQKRNNIGIVAELNNPVIDYSIIAAAKIAHGIRDFTNLTEDMIRTVGPKYKEFADEVYVKATNRFRRESGLPSTTQLERVIRDASSKFDDVTKKNLRRMAAEIGYYTDENIKRELTQDLQEIMKTYGKATLGEQVAGVQTAMQLLSLPTFARNTLGNAGQFALEKINKVSGVPIDWALSKFTKERTIQFLPKNQEKMWKNFVSGTNSGWRGVNSMGTLDSYNVKPNVFSDKNPLKYLSKLTGASLQGMDYAAYRAAYGDVMATYAEQMGKAQGLSNADIKSRMPELLMMLDDRVKDIADQAGKYATYQDETLLSRGAQGTKQALNAVTDKISKAAVTKGIIPKRLSMEGFGLGDVVLKYAKTPANLVMRGIDYSPLGFIRAIGEFAPLLKGKEQGIKSFNQYQATRAISRAITGTVGLSATGYAMADAGLLTGASSTDPDKRSIEEQSGKGAYKANLSGIYRWIASGFDKKEAQYQKGDRMMDYAWIQPAAISLGMGVNFRSAQDAKKPGENISNVELAKRSIIGGLRTVLENPMVTGLSDVVGGLSDLITRQDDKKLKGIVKGIPSSFVPAVSGQLRNATDNTQRETFDPNILKEMVNLVKNRVPGLSKQLPIAYDSLGNKRERIQGGKSNTLGQYLNSFVNPTKFTTYNVSPEAQIVLDILNESKDGSVLPRISKRSIEVTNTDTKQKETIKLTNEQYSTLQQKMGLAVAEEIRKKQDYLTSPDHTIDKKAKKIKDILTRIGSDVRDDLREEMGY